MVIKKTKSDLVVVTKNHTYITSLTLAACIEDLEEIILDIVWSMYEVTQMKK